MATQTTTHQTNRLAPPNPAFTMQSQPPTKSLDRVRVYKDFLTPALHRRFTRSALLALVACYLESLFIRIPSPLWFWNPISLTGARTILLFGPCLAIFIVRVANLQIGESTSLSSAVAVFQGLKSFRVWHTLAWHIWSAWFFGELYIWSRPNDAHLTWVDPGQSYERPRLNENPIFLRSFLICLGIAQTVLHLSRGYDRIPVSAQETSEQSKEKSSDPATAVQELSVLAPAIVGRTVKLALPGLIYSIPIYFIFVRHVVWPYCLIVGRTIHHDLPPSSRPTGIGVDHVFLLIWQSATSAVMLVFLWEFSNAVFTIYVAQPPLKKEEPLTSEIKDLQGNVVSKSKDPNASLLSGLRSKREVLKTFAFWELWLICSRFDIRRKTFYTEVDRDGGSSWAQISEQCTNELEAIVQRIKQAKSSPPPKDAHPAPQPSQQAVDQSAQQGGDLFGMPRIADRKVQDGNVWQAPRSQDLARNVGNAMKSIGQSPSSASPIGPQARRALEWSRDKLISKQDQERYSHKALAQDASGLAVWLLKSPPGEPFRRTFANAARAVVLGSPNSRKAIIIFAAKSLARLAVCSLKEDDYGQVAKSIPNIIRTFTATINEINAFTSTFAPDWTDVNFTPGDRETITDVREVIDVLRGGLQDVVLAFGEYAAAVGITKIELRLAREAIGSRPDVRKVA